MVDVAFIQWITGVLPLDDHGKLQASGIDLTADVVKAKILQDVKWPL